MVRLLAYDNPISRLLHSGHSSDYSSGHSGTVLLGTTRVDQPAFVADMAALLAAKKLWALFPPSGT